MRFLCDASSLCIKTHCIVYTDVTNMDWGDSAQPMYVYLMYGYGYHTELQTYVCTMQLQYLK